MRVVLIAFFKNFYSFLTNKNYRTFLRLSLLNNSTKRFQERNIRFNNLRFRIPDALSFVWQYHEVFFEESFYFKTKKEKPVIVDCGANVGTVTSYFKILYPNAIVHSFEPDLKIFEYLKKNVEQNGFKGVNLYNQAVWNKNEILTFMSEGADSGALYKGKETEGNLVEVKAIDLNLFLDKLDKIDFLKIDIEGAEHTIFPHIADSLNKVDRLFVEFHSFMNERQDLDVILKILQDNGFTYFINNILNIKKPYAEKPKGVMNNQLNIYAFRDSPYIKN